MVAILVDGRSEGETGWIATRGMGRIKVEGLAGCQVEVMAYKHDNSIIVTDDGIYDLPVDTDFVKVKHTKTNKDSRVFVDLVRE